MNVALQLFPAFNAVSVICQIENWVNDECSLSEPKLQICHGLSFVNAVQLPTLYTGITLAVFMLSGKK